MSPRLYFFVVLLITSELVLLEGCGSSEQITLASVSFPGIPVRDFLYANESPAAGYGAYGYVLLTSRANTANHARYQKVCEGFFDEFVSAGEFASYQKQSLMITFWPTDSLTHPSPQRHDCDLLLAHYDFVRATTILSAINKQSIQGPLLVAFTTSYHAGVPISTALVLDMSNFADEDVDLAFRIWKDRISRDPNEWNKGFTVQKVVLEFRNLINKYGQQIVDVFKT